MLRAHPALRTVAAVAREEDVGVHLSGGALRDLSLGRTPRDLDFFVEGDAARLAATLAGREAGTAARLDVETGPVFRHRGQMGQLDFVSCGGTPIRDFIRRHADFTLNALLFDVRAGSLMDDFAAPDIARRTVRAMTSNPFASRCGPARLLRAVRFALLTPDMALESDTAAAIRGHRHLLATVQRHTVGDELGLILEADECPRGIALLEDLGLRSVLFRAFLPSAAAVADEGEGGVAGILERIRRLDTFFAGPMPSLASPRPFLRQILFFTCGMRARLLALRPANRKAFLIDTGERLETALRNLFRRPDRAFRLRMIGTAYLAALDAVGRGATIEDAVRWSIATFGRTKGRWAALLLCADGGEHGSDDAQGSAVAGALVQEIAARTPSAVPSGDVSRSDVHGGDPRC